MPVIAAPLEALAALGEFTRTTMACLLTIACVGFVLVGIPIYYLTSQNDAKSTPPFIGTAKFALHDAFSPLNM